jgi:hypothetical protein
MGRPYHRFGARARRQTVEPPSAMVGRLKIAVGGGSIPASGSRCGISAGLSLIPTLFRHSKEARGRESERKPDGRSGMARAGGRRGRRRPTATGRETGGPAAVERKGISEPAIGGSASGLQEWLPARPSPPAVR